MNKKIILVILGIISLSGLGWFAVTVALPPSVSVITPERGIAVEAIYATGTVEPSVLIPLSPKATARLSALLVDEGHAVKKGDVLASFEDTDLTAIIAQIEAQVRLTSRELTRKEKLVKKNYVSAEAYDKAKANFDVATASLQEANAKRSYLQLTAPEDSTVIRRDGEIGEVIPAGQPVFYLSCCQPIRISAEVDEEDIVHVAAGQKVLIQSDAFPNHVFDGTVTAITPKGDTTSRSFRVRIAPKGDFPLLIGMTTETNIIIKESQNALLIPFSALSSKNTVQIVRDGVVFIQKVKTGAEGKETIEITEGIDDNTAVISPYSSALKDGDKIRERKNHHGDQ